MTLLLAIKPRFPEITQDALTKRVLFVKVTPPKLYDLFPKTHWHF